MSYLQFVSHLSVALLCGLCIGVERQWHRHPAGLRTNALISLGACLFASLSLMMENDSSPTRIAAQIVTGVGFLAGGVILRDGLNVKGLTTAATIWCTAAIGTLIGCGFHLFAITSTLFVLFLNLILHPLSEWFDKVTRKQFRMMQRYQLELRCDAINSAAIRASTVGYFQNRPALTLNSIQQADADSGGCVTITAAFTSNDRCDEQVEGLMAQLQLEQGLREVRWQRVEAEPRIDKAGCSSL